MTEEGDGSPFDESSKECPTHEKCTARRCRRVGARRTCGRRSDAAGNGRITGYASNHARCSASPVTLNDGHLRPSFKVVLGHDAIRYREIADATADPETEADAVGPDGKSELIYAWTNDGYVSIDDWKNLNPDELLNAVKENTAAANEVRRTKGIPTLEVAGWIQKPTLDPANNAVTWAFKAKASDGVEVINAIALKLGRFGYERIAWIGDPTLYQSGNDLALAVKDFDFDQGARYGDYEVGKDRIAAYGVAGLVAGIIAGKAANVGMLAALVLFGKKFAIIIGVGVVALLSRFKSLFRRKPQTT